MTREDIIKWAQEAQLPYYFPAVAKQQQTGEIAYSNELMRFAELVAAAERKREWVWLTGDEADDIWNRYCDEMGEASINDAYDIISAVGAKLKEKNA